MRMQEKQFRIGELAQLIGVERFVIRFWEKEFDISSDRSHGGQRFYVQKDVVTFKTIKKLLHEDGFTIAGAKQILSHNNSAIIGSQKTTMHESSALTIEKELSHIKNALISLKNML